MLSRVENYLCTQQMNASFATNLLCEHRQEVKVLREGASLNKEHLTIQWLSESITELRNEMTELQESTTNVTRVVQFQLQHESPAMEEINELKESMSKMQLQLKAMRTRQDKSDSVLKQLRDEAIQQAADLKKWMQQHKGEVVSTHTQTHPLLFTFMLFTYVHKSNTLYI